jgi:hypothetical protein
MSKYCMSTSGKIFPEEESSPNQLSISKDFDDSCEGEGKVW